jgi:ABC-type Fe3+-siderophore transport system permease subunit
VRHPLLGGVLRGAIVGFCFFVVLGLLGGFRDPWFALGLAIAFAAITTIFTYLYFRGARSDEGI